MDDRKREIVNQIIASLESIEASLKAGGAIMSSGFDLEQWINDLLEEARRMSG